MTVVSDDVTALERGLLTSFTATLRRDLRLAIRSRAAWLNPLLFVLIVLTLFALGLGAGQSVLVEYAGAILWVVMLLAVMLSADGVFSDDYRDGSLEQLLLVPEPVYLPVLAKMLAHWLAVALPMLLVAPLFCLMLSIPMSVLPALILALLVGIGTLCCFAALGAALTIGVSGGGLLVALLILPLYVPVVIFGTAFLQAALVDEFARQPLLILLAMLCAALVLAPLAVVAALRVSADS